MICWIASSWPTIRLRRSDVEFLRLEARLRRIQLLIKPPHTASPLLDSQSHQGHFDFE